MKKQIKRILAMLIVATLVAMSVFSGLSLSASALQRLDTFRAYYYLRAGSGITQVTNSFTFNYTHSGAAYQSEEWTSGSMGGNLIYTGGGGGNEFGGGATSVAIWTFNQPIVIGGLLNTFTFHCAGNVEFRAYSNNLFVDVNLVRMGDVNNNGIVDSSDAMQLWGFINTGSPLTNRLSADINNDGIITSADLTILTNYVNGVIDRLA